MLSSLIPDSPSQLLIVVIKLPMDLPGHLTPASWEWSQVISPRPACLSHSSNEDSVPEQWSWSRKIGPELGPK